MKRVVLVRTVGPRNAGMVLRAVANFGPAELWLVAPVRPSVLRHPEFEQMAHGVENVRERVCVVDSLPEALAECTSSIGFTARARGDRTRVDWRDVRDEVLERCEDQGQRVALVFGSETSGLSAGETDLCQRLAYLPTADEHTSINLAMCAGIVLSSLFAAPGAHGREPGARLVKGADLEYLKRHLKHVLGGEVARGASARHDIEASIERVFARAPIESRDARAWHMMMRALGSRMSPLDFGLEGTPRRRRRRAALQRARRRELGGEAPRRPPEAP